ncbi:hypothetical protein KLA_11085 [Cellulophaga geojensis KL-A]|uniref:Uncharacterized protein n=1 Tax=Cellulophaga geojensis KL-A TaxID=1328323 RepID=A0ABN0RMC9_9FLAO|nr:hypothetical protein [Cellulophaga geojensis]EWH13084.1 hypothetical protein KLA_11085 [Cellulophaga geojensis KL-A]
MKIEKYNQRLLAVLGTVGVIFLIVALIAFISITIMEHRRYDDDVETGILSDEKIEELQKENKREQVISYENPRLIDTINSVYIIPVSHKTLNEQEDISGLLNLNKSSSSYKPSDTRYSRQYYGAFNNLIVYNPKNGMNKKLFDKRVNFNLIKTEYFEDDILLLMNVSEKDTYKDGVINLKDFKSLYVYSLTKKELKKVGIEGMDVFNFKFLNNEKNLTIQFGVDKNKDGQFEEYNEPTLIKRFDFNSGKLTDIIDEKISSELQKTLEGTKK